MRHEDRKGLIESMSPDEVMDRRRLRVKLVGCPADNQREQLAVHQDAIEEELHRLLQTNSAQCEEFYGYFNAVSIKPDFRSGSWSCDNALEDIGRPTTGGISGIVVGFEHILPIWSGGKSSRSFGHPERLRGDGATKTKSSQASIAAISGLMPTMFMTRVKL